MVGAGGSYLFYEKQCKRWLGGGYEKFEEPSERRLAFHDVDFLFALAWQIEWQTK